MVSPRPRSSVCVPVTSGPYGASHPLPSCAVSHPSDPYRSHLYQAHADACAACRVSYSRLGQRFREGGLLRPESCIQSLESWLAVSRHPSGGRREDSFQVICWCVSCHRLSSQSLIALFPPLQPGSMLRSSLGHYCGPGS